MNDRTDMIPLSIDAAPREGMTDEELSRLVTMAQQYGPDILTVEESSAMRAMFKQMTSGARGHYENLAEYMDEADLTYLANRICEWVEIDDKSRSPWYEREATAIKMLGFSDEVEGGADFEGAARVVYPLLGEACIQFQARAIAELWPASGPVDTVVVGKSTPEIEAQRERVRAHMNYQYLYEMPGAYDEEDRLLFRLPISGSCFTKISYEPMFDRVIRRFVPAEDFIVPYKATDLFTAPRYTHRMRESINEVKRKMVEGYYREIDMGPPAELQEEPNQLHEQIDATQGREDPGAGDNDDRYTNLEMHVWLRLKDDPHVDETGLKTGLARPYVVTVNKDDMVVLSIRRNWDEQNTKETKLEHFTHRKFFPGLGFYGFGYLHVLGGLQRSSTGITRAILDASQFANMPAGYRAKQGHGLPNGNTPLAPGEWREVEATFEDLQKAFFKLPYSGPNEAMFKMLEILVEAGQRFASISDATVGDTPTNAPVGTTLAVIEQAVKLFSAIHKRQHEALKQEFAIVARLNRDNLPKQGYPFAIEGEDYTVAATDYDDRVDIIPVSDPNIVTSSQRIAQAQTLYTVAQENPDLYNRREVNKRLLTAIRIQNIDEILLDPTQIPRLGVVEENIAMTMGQPVRVFIDQDHTAHAQAHKQWFETLPASVQKNLMPSYMAHQAEHLAMSYKVQVLQAYGGQYPEAQDPNQPLPPEIENQIARQVAGLVQLMPAPVDPAPESGDGGDEARKEAIAQADIRRKDITAAADIHRKDVVAQADINRKNITAAADAHRGDVVAAAGITQDNVKALTQLQQGSEAHAQSMKHGAEDHQSKMRQQKAGGKKAA